MSLTKIEGVDKEDIREVFLPRKNTLTALDYNEIKEVVNDAIDIAVVFVSGAGIVPDLNIGQLGLNTTDGILYAGTSQGIMFIPLNLI
jgi:hypothetical protein